MTPVHKLSIIIGFSVVLVVAIIVTDHLSPANKNKIAKLEQNQTTNTNDIRNRQLPTGIGSSSKYTNQPDNNSSGGIHWDRDAGNYDYKRNSQKINPEQQQNRTESIFSLRPASEALSLKSSEVEVKDYENQNNNYRNSSENDRIHTVKPDETLYAIAKYYYGDGSLADELAVYNTDRVPDNLIIIPDLELLIPDRNVLLGNNSNTNNNSTANSSRNNIPLYIEYKIKPGDTMTEISMEKLGTFRRWREIYELNKDVIDDPDILKAGVTIKIPTTN